MTVLSSRAVNRARLDRQWLTAPRMASAAEAIEHLVGLQAQLPDAPYYQLWSRLPNLRTTDVSELLQSRAAVRVVMMRGTIHLVTAADCLRLRPVIQTYLDRNLFNGSQAGKKIVGIDPAELVARGRDVLAAGPLHNDELSRRLGEHFPQYDGNDLAYGLRCAMPLIQVPPRGVWGLGGGLTYASVPQWLGREVEADSTPDGTILRYLAAFGPASVADFQTWSCLTRCKEAFDRLRPELVSYRDPDGRELFDIAGTVLPEAESTLRPILLGPFDNVLLSHVDRTYVISKEHQKRVFTHNGIVKGTVLIDGYVAGSWKPVLKKRTATIHFEAFDVLSPTDKEFLEAEGLRLLNFSAEESAERTVEFT